MQVSSLLERRLASQKLVGPPLATPSDAVSWLGAVQAQDYSGAKWALGLRCQGLTDAAVDAAFDAGEILRTHVLRPTWHFLAPADIRWILSLSAPNVHRASASVYRRCECDARLLGRCHRVIERVLEGHHYLTRGEIGAALAKQRISATGLRLAYIVMHAELEGLICSGPRRSKQFTYALIDERAPASKSLSRQDALAELTRRYLQSHGPATVRDYAWWSGLTMRDARAGFETIGRARQSETVVGITYSFLDAPAARARRAPLVHLLPNYDEYLIAYKDRALAGATLNPSKKPIDVYAHFMIVDGRFAGTWRRRIAEEFATVSVTPLAPLGQRHERALESAAARYARFVGKPLRWAD